MDAIVNVMVVICLLQVVVGFPRNGDSVTQSDIFILIVNAIAFGFGAQKLFTSLVAN